MEKQSVFGKTPFERKEMVFPPSASIDDILSSMKLHRRPSKILFRGMEAEYLSSYVTGWAGIQGFAVVVLDGANHFDPYVVSSVARRRSVSPEKILKRIRIARAFTCYQMVALVEEKLAALVEQVLSSPSPQIPWIVILGPVTTFLDEDVPEKEARRLFEKTLKSIDRLSGKGIPFLLFQSSLPEDCRRGYLSGKLFQLVDLVLGIIVTGEGYYVSLEKRSPYSGYPLQHNPSKPVYSWARGLPFSRSNSLDFSEF